MPYSFEFFSEARLFCLDTKIHLLIFCGEVLYGISLSLNLGLNYCVHLSIAFIFMLRCTSGNTSCSMLLWDKGLELTLKYWFSAIMYMCYTSLAICSFLSFFPLSMQRYWMGVFTLTRTNSCAMRTPSIGVTLSRTPRLNCWWCHPTTATSDVSIARGWKPVQPVTLDENQNYFF